MEPNLEELYPDMTMLYHGTSLNAAIEIVRNGFIRSKKGMLGPGVYMTPSLQKARAYPKQNSRKKLVLVVGLYISRPILVLKPEMVIKGQMPPRLAETEATVLVQSGTGITPSGLPEMCVRSPEDVFVVGWLSQEDTEGMIRSIDEFPLDS